MCFRLSFSLFPYYSSFREKLLGGELYSHHHIVSYYVVLQKKRLSVVGIMSANAKILCWSFCFEKCEAIQAWKSKIARKPTMYWMKSNNKIIVHCIAYDPFKIVAKHSIKTLNGMQNRGQAMSRKKLKKKMSVNYCGSSIGLQWRIEKTELKS